MLGQHHYTKGGPMAVPHEGAARNVEIPSDDCLGLLGSVSVGRIAWIQDDVPRILPVNHRILNGQVMIRTGEGSDLATHAVGAPVAFEVDNVDFVHLTGWSVIVNGTCRAVDDDRIRGLALDSLTSWVEGAKAQVLTIESTSVTGRRIVAEADSSA
jgi:nitroimidazol reductase NimA-like FMN-containing flavoprotein (pyridoxamine 5'-phosphate oxidase superfamily)